MEAGNVTRAQETIDISNLPEVDRLAEEVRMSRTPRVLRRGNEIIATMVPATAPQATRPAQRRQTKNIEQRAFDLLVAATALTYQLTLVTRDTADYADIPGLIIY
jgi:predicted nucleic acid-binding protein